MCIINDIMYRQDGYNKFVNYNDDMTHLIHESVSITKVSNVLTGYKLKPSNWTEETLNDNLLWSRVDELKEGDYVELLECCCGYKDGDIGEIVKIELEGFTVNVPCRTSTSGFTPNVWIWKDDVKKSTKEAYDEFNNPQEYTMEQLTELVGHNFKIKK